MEISAEEFLALSKGMSERDVRIAQLEQEVAALQSQKDKVAAENTVLKEDNKRLNDLMVASRLESMFLANYIMLSVERIKSFVSQLRDIDRWSFIRTFVQWSVPKELEALERDRIEEALAMPNVHEALEVKANQVVVGNGGTVNYNQQFGKEALS